MLPAIRDSMTILDVEYRCQELIDAAETISLKEAEEQLAGLAAIEEYLARKNLAGPVQSAARHTERRIGELLAHREPGKRTDLEPVDRDQQVAIDRATISRFRLIAEHWDAIVPALPCSRAAALRIAEAARDTDEEKQPPDSLVYTLEAWMRASLEAREQAIAMRGTRTFNRQVAESIEWAKWSWNPVTGCLHNCPYCYARDIANRFYPEKFAPALHPERLTAPVNTKVPADAAQKIGWKNVFVCSMADLFGKWVPEEWIRAVLDQVERNPQWNFLFLTKFPNRLAEFTFPDNAWVGTTVDCQARVANAEQSFRRVKATVKWLSVEPMLEPLQFSDIGAFQWLVLGGASDSSETPEWRPPHAWILDIEDAARAAGVPFYEKTNLWHRLQGFPGQPDVRYTVLPDALRYIPSIG